MGERYPFDMASVNNGRGEVNKNLRSALSDLRSALDEDVESGQIQEVKREVKEDRLEAVVYMAESESEIKEDK